METPFSLNNKKILVTGASSGIGKSCAIECAKLGAKIFANGRDEARLAGTISELCGENHVAIPGDFLDENFPEKLAESLSGTTIDGIIHAAGISKFRPIAFSSPKNIDETFRVYFSVPVELTRQLFRKNLLGNGASVVFISSISGTKISGVGQSVYAASKAALSGFTKALALELAPQKNRVNCVCPGAVETPILKLSGLSDEQLEADKKKYPLGRFGKPEEVAYACIYLLSSAAEWTTGTEIFVDGGISIS